MKNGYGNGRIAARVRDASGPAGPRGSREPSYAIATYPNHEDFQAALKRNFGVDVGEAYKWKIRGPVKIGTNCCVRLYVDNHDGLYKALVTRQELTDKQARAALKGVRRV